MATVKEFLERLRAAKEQFIQNRDADVLRISLDQIALVKLRVQGTGIDSDGQPFVPYSPDYAKSRKKAGYQVQFVDFTRTGRMFASIQPKIKSSTAFSTTIEIVASNELDQVKLDSNSKRRKNILAPSAEELEMIKEANRNRIKRYFNF